MIKPLARLLLTSSVEGQRRPAERRHATIDANAIADPTPARTSEDSARAAVRPMGRPLRVAVLQTQAEGAGAQEISRILSRGLRSRGYEVHQIFFYRRTAAFDRETNVFFCSMSRPAGIVPLVRMALALVGRLRTTRPDVVVCFQHYGNVIGTLAAWIAGARLVVANRTTAKSAIPRWVHAIELALGLSGLQHSVVVNSPLVEREYQAYPRRFRDRIVRIDHGFEPKTSALTTTEARRTFGLPADATILGSAARLHRGKNLAAAIRLLVNREWHLALAGQGPAYSEIVTLAVSLGVSERIHFVGELPPDQIGNFLRALDVFVFPTLAETFGLAVVEAAQARVPVVANDLAVLRETLRIDGEPCAFFADPENTGAFASAVQRLLDDAELRAALSSRGARLSAQYPLETMVQRYVELIEVATSTAATGAAPKRSGSITRRA